MSYISRTIFYFAALVLLPCVAHGQSIASAADPLLEVGRSPANPPSAPATSGFKIVSYNIRYRSGDDLKKMIELFKSNYEIGDATLLGLQEVDRNKKRTGNVNTARQIAEALGYYYAWACPPPAAGKEETAEEGTGVAIFSRYPISEITHLILPHPGPHGRRRAAIGATVQIGDRKVRFYSIHADSRVSVNSKLEQQHVVLEDLDKYDKSMPAILVGDFNTWQKGAVSRTVKVFTERGFVTPIPENKPTLQVLFVRLKLDWIWLRGFKPEAYGIGTDIGLSDHWPIWVKASFLK
jgi:endonuclease/exonuclease/phosphatase family metal-dependent hydrolase